MIPTEAKAPGAANARGFQESTNTPDSANACEKHKANLIAGFALRGYAVHEADDGGFLVCRWNLSRHCPDLAALGAFARMVGVRT